MLEKVNLGNSARQGARLLEELLQPHASLNYDKPCHIPHDLLLFAILKDIDRRLAHDGHLPAGSLFPK